MALSGEKKTMSHWIRTTAVAVGLLGLQACSPGGDASSDSGALSLDYERYELSNGLDVILHVDRSDPVAAVTMAFHVGSAREVAGRTGFAHLFEHLFFLDSENLGPGGLDRLMTRSGSSTNGFTTNDNTNYFEVVPSDALEKVLWAEADKLGYFINTVTESVVAKEKQVVKNEKRQGVDNRPYGHVSYVVDQALYPEDHPYQWQVIGSLADLDAAELSDVKEFHSRWYGPNNGTLVVAGDIDVAQTKTWIEKYFGEIPAADMPPQATPPEVNLAATRLLFHEDNFAQLPQLTLTWPTVPLYHDDAYALDLLSSLLTDGKSTPFYKVIVEEAQLAPRAGSFHRSMELAGSFTIQINAFPNTDLDDVASAVEIAFGRFEAEGVAAEDLARVKAGVETAFYGGLSSVLGKAFQLAAYNMFADDPGYIEEDLARTLAVTESDLIRVYDTYLKDQPYVATSFVPRGQAELAVTASVRAEVIEEPIVQGAEAPVEVIHGNVVETASAFDRSVEPDFGTSPSLRVPRVWETTLANGLPVRGIEDNELPLVVFQLRFHGGLLLEDADKPGVANLMAELMTQGTANRTPAELEQAIESLGASINVSAGTQSVVIGASTLARNFEATMALVEEILLEPRWDEAEFALAKDRVMNGLRQRGANPAVMASDAFAELIYGDHILAHNAAGTLVSVESMEMEDLQAYYGLAIVPGTAALNVVGAVEEGQVLSAISAMAEMWQGEAPSFPAAPEWNQERAGLYFLDVPGASQSALRIGYLALPEIDPDFYPATIMNFRLGGGGFASSLTQELREGQGYTYGIGSGFAGTTLAGPFTIGSSVRSNVTFESLALIKDLMTSHGDDFDAEDLEVTQGFLLRSNAMAFETLGSKLGILNDMATLGFPSDYALARETTVRDMTVEGVRALAEKYLDPEGMIWLVAGDAATQLERLSELGLGAPTVITR